MQNPQQTPAPDVGQLLASLAALPPDKIDSLVSVLGKLRPKPAETAPAVRAKPLRVAKRIEPAAVVAASTPKAADAIAVGRRPMPSGEFDLEITVDQFYESWFKPVLLRQLRRVDEKTVTIYDAAVDHWRRIIGDVPMATIDDDTLATFVAALENSPGRLGANLSGHTVRRHCVSLQSMFYTAGPSRPGIKHCRNLIPNAPQFGRIQTPPVECKGEFTLDELAAMWRAAPRMQTPTVPGATPGQWWRGLLAFFYFGAVRCYSGLSMRLADVAPDGWARVPDESAKAGRGYRIYLPQRALEAIAFGDPRRERVLPLPTAGEFRFAVSNVRCRFKTLQRIAGIPIAYARGFHGLRKLAATELAKIDPIAARFQLGHRGGSVLEQHYLSRGILPDVVNQMPWPIAEGEA